MKLKLTISSLLLSALSLVVAPAALGTTTWYVDGVHGSDSNNCLSAATACKTIGHAISRASSGDSIMVAAATYTENLGVSISLKIIGAAAKTTIIDGGGKDTVVAISTNAHVILSGLTIRNGKFSVNRFGSPGGGIRNAGTLTVNDSTISGNAARGGGGIANFGTLALSNSTISGNTAFAGGPGVSYGGGIYNNNAGTLTVKNGTISGNAAAARRCIPKRNC